MKCRILIHVVIIKHVKLTNIQILKVVLAKKILMGKLALECEDEILNATNTLLNDKKVDWTEIN